MLDALAARLAGHGLRLRGGFHPADEDGVPARAATLLLVGNAGAEMWPHFVAHPAHLLADDPLDAWTREVLSAIAASLGAQALFPFGGKPHLPFQRWAMRAEDVHVSPLKLLIHPVYGLWHAYRGALAFAERLALPPRQARPSPCDSCTARPCLAACPVGAFANDGYDVARCVVHLRTPPGEDCRALACRARRACPVGAAFRYTADQARFHTAAFLRNKPP